MIKAFAPRIGDGAVEDFRRRLELTRLPDPEVVPDWSQGLPIKEAIRLRDALYEHDFTPCLARMESLGSARTDIGDVDVHFLQVDGPPGSTPLVLTHGWPGGIIEFFDVVEALSQHHTLVIPSLPGYGFSTAPRETGWGVERMADVIATLMARLGHDRYIAQGGDWGAEISALLAHRHSDACLGAHINLVSARPPRDVVADPTLDEAAQLARLRDWGRMEMGYYRQQASRPQTLGYGLSDSPMALATWIAEKLHAWTDPDLGRPYGAVSTERLLDLICLYWFTNSATAAARLYWESGYSSGRTEISAPVACTLYPHEINAPSRRWAESRYRQIVSWDVAERGGHFPAIEVPEDFVDSVLAGVAAVLAA